MRISDWSSDVCSSDLRTRQGVSAVLSTNDGLRDRHAPGVALQRAASVSQCTNRGSGAGLHDGTTVNRPTIPAIKTSFHQTGVGLSGPVCYPEWVRFGLPPTFFRSPRQVRTTQSGARSSPLSRRAALVILLEIGRAHVCTP